MSKDYSKDNKSSARLRPRKVVIDRILSFSKSYQKAIERFPPVQAN